MLGAKNVVATRTMLATTIKKKKWSNATFTVTVPLNAYIETWFSVRLLCNQCALQRAHNFCMKLRYDEIDSLSRKWGILAFSHDVIKIQTKKLSLLLSFYFQVVLQHLKTFIKTNFRFKRNLRFATLDAWICSLLRDAAFSWRPGKLLCGLKTLPILRRFCYLNITCPRINITLIFMSSSSEDTRTDVSVGFRRPYLCPWKGDKHGVCTQGFINSGKTFFRASRIWNIAPTWFLARLFVHLSS